MAEMRKRVAALSKHAFAMMLPLAMLTTSGMTGIGKHDRIAGQVTQASVPLDQCLSAANVSQIVRILSSGTYNDQQAAVALLTENAKRSATCRKQVIAELLSAMDKPNLDLTGGTPQFYVWHYGIQVLGNLKAVEALDLLIASFDLNDGTGFPLDHHPALVGVIDIGEVALPKLQTVLKENSDPYMRQYAVFCIAQIGGQSADQLLREAAKNESNPCVSASIRASLAAFHNKRRPHYISDESRAKWYGTFLCTSP
jgi:hypothetical protein